MKIRIEPHTLELAEERGANEAEIIDVIENGFPIEVKYNRKGRNYYHYCLCLLWKMAVGVGHEYNL